MSVSCTCCVFTGRGLCVWMIIRPEKSYRVWCVWVWSWWSPLRGDHEPASGRSGRGSPQTLKYCNLQIRVMRYKLHVL